MKKELGKIMKVELPLVPNFLRVGDMTVPVADFSVAELKAVGKWWTQELIRKQVKRK